jgi:hypothetical protein
MERKTPRSFGPCQLRRAALPLGAVAAAAMVLAACSSQASAGNSAVQLSAASGPTSSKPTWSTSAACPSGLQGSAVFREVHRDGVSTNSISPAVNGTTAPFHGTLQASIALIKAVGGIPDGSTQKLVVICFSTQGETGSSRQVMNLYITYSADGKSYTTSAKAPAGS